MLCEILIDALDSLEYHRAIALCIWAAQKDEESSATVKVGSRFVRDR